jgi:tetratricopeptide (TPR) repeat protein
MRRVAADWAYIEQLQYSGDEMRWKLDSFQSYRHWGDEILWLDPSFHHAIEENAVVLAFAVEDKKHALEYLRRAADMDPRHVRYKELIGAMLYESEADLDKALELLKRDIQRGEASEMLMRIVGNIYVKYQRWEEAARYWAWICARAKMEFTLLRCAEVGALLKKKGY